MSPGPYRVIWKRSAVEIDLAAAVVRAITEGYDQTAITRAMESADRALATNPNGIGESRPNFERIETFAPLNVRYAVHDDERLVYVLVLTYTPHRHRG